MRSTRIAIHQRIGSDKPARQFCNAFDVSSYPVNINNKKILITGADGFIGSHLTEALVRRGCDVRAFVFYNSFNSWGWLNDSPEEVRSQLDVFSGDIRDYNAVRTAIKDCEIVFHLAALISIPYSYVAPESYVETNIRGTLNVVQAAGETCVEKVIHTSTSEVYGTARTVPIAESHPLNAQSPYAASKIGADQIAMSFYYSFGTPVSIVRPFNTYGPRQSARAVIPTIILQIAEGKKTIRLGSLHPTRDFNYIADTVNGFIEIAVSDRTVGETVNIGSNYEISIGDTVRLIAEVMKTPIEIETEDIRVRPAKSEVERLWADNAKIKDLTAWKPQYGGLDGLRRGLNESVRWFSKKDNMKKYNVDLYNI